MARYHNGWVRKLDLCACVCVTKPLKHLQIICGSVDQLYIFFLLLASCKISDISLLFPSPAVCSTTCSSQWYVELASVSGSWPGSSHEKYKNCFMRNENDIKYSMCEVQRSLLLRYELSSRSLWDFTIRQRLHCCTSRDCDFYEKVKQQYDPISLSK